MNIKVFPFVGDDKAIYYDENNSLIKITGKLRGTAITQCFNIAPGLIEEVDCPTESYFTSVDSPVQIGYSPVFFITLSENDQIPESMLSAIKDGKHTLRIDSEDFYLEIFAILPKADCQQCLLALGGKHEKNKIS